MRITILCQTVVGLAVHADRGRASTAALLTTHLTFREIAERLFVSRNTVKTQAISAYRKLDASSRSEAIERAIELGLVDASPGSARISPAPDDVLGRR